MAQRRPLLRLVFHGFLALVSFYVVSSWIRSGIKWSEAFGVRAKLEAFAETKDQYDAVYIGSSTVFRAFRPDVIDPIISRHGVPFRSFNLGMPGMWSFESHVLLTEVLAMNPAKLSWVVVEAPLWKADLFSPFRRVTERSVRWHPPALTARILWSIWLEHHSLKDKLHAGWLHLRQTAMRTANYALGPSWWQSLLGPNSPGFEASVQRYRKTRGYEPLESSEVPGVRQRRIDFLRDRELYLRAVQAFSLGHTATATAERAESALSRPGQIEAAGNSQSLERYNLSALEHQRLRLEHANVKLVYFVLPGVDPGRLFVDLHQQGHLPLLLDYKQPSRYPEFYTLSSRFDVWHLSKLGAERFSRVFAQDLLEIIESDRVR
jgi:hypothetical protein